MRMTLLRQQSAQPLPFCQHASAEAYARYIRGYTENARQIRHLLGFRARFVRGYPDLGDWMRAPLAERVGRLYGEEREQPTCRVSYEARPYLMFLALHGYAQLGMALGCPSPVHLEFARPCRPGFGHR